VTCKWALLYIERWLTASMEHEDGTKAERKSGTPQGGGGSPILSNLFLHYTFDLWMARRRDTVPDLFAPITPQEAERVWKSQARASARSVATALTHAGRPVHFTTVARWRRQGLLTIARSSDHPLAGMQGVHSTESAEPEAGSEDPFAELPPPVTPLEAKQVWDEQRRPSSRSVAKAITRAGRPVHFTTVARWKKREWQVEARLEHPLAAAMRKVDLAVPLLPGDANKCNRIRAACNR
jgi:hypothetical protein